MLDLLTGRVECCRQIGQEEGLKQDEGIRWWRWMEIHKINHRFDLNFMFVTFIKVFYKYLYIYV